jgi:hypothetical protein
MSDFDSPGFGANINVVVVEYQRKLFFSLGGDTIVTRDPVRRLVKSGNDNRRLLIRRAVESIVVDAFDGGRAHARNDI